MRNSILKHSPEWQYLLDSISEIDSDIPDTLNAVMKELLKSNHELLNEWEESGLDEKIEPYLFYYVVPLIELCNTEKKTIDIKTLAVQLLCCFTWRAYDNSIDGHVKTPNSQLQLINAYHNLLNFSKSQLDEHQIKSLKTHFKIMADQAENELTEPISIQNIWKRCSVFLFVPTDICKLTSDNLNLFRQYINYNGIAHDLHDIIGDFSQGVQSLPVHWMNEINPNQVFSKEMVDKLYLKVRHKIEPLESFFEQRQIAMRYPIINLLLEQARITFEKH